MTDGIIIYAATSLDNHIIFVLDLIHSNFVYQLHMIFIFNFVFT